MPVWADYPEESTAATLAEPVSGSPARDTPVWVDCSEGSTVTALAEPVPGLPARDTPVWVDCSEGSTVTAPEEPVPGSNHGGWERPSGCPGRARAHHDTAHSKGGTPPYSNTGDTGRNTDTDRIGRRGRVPADTRVRPRPLCPGRPRQLGGEQW